MVKIYTAQYKYNGIDRVDITVKTSDKVFAPTWNIVIGHKRGYISDEEYFHEYRNLMLHSYKINKPKWEKLLLQNEITLVCFCESGKFCHRLILAEFLVKLGAEYIGERVLTKI